MRLEKKLIVEIKRNVEKWSGDRREIGDGSPTERVNWRTSERWQLKIRYTSTGNTHTQWPRKTSLKKLDQARVARFNAIKLVYNQ